LVFIIAAIGKGQATLSEPLLKEKDVNGTGVYLEPSAK